MKKDEKMLVWEGLPFYIAKENVLELYFSLFVVQGSGVHVVLHLKPKHK